jgi:parallel beta-helix repeat protein
MNAEILTIVMIVVFLILFLMFPILVRFGPLILPWVKLNKDQIRFLKEAQQRYRLSHPRIAPLGKPLYKKKMYTPDGFIVYSNGVYAKFCTGRSGTYRFVPVPEVSGIYPVRIELPPGMAAAASRKVPPSWKALQIETESLMVCLVHSRSHDFQDLVPILKQAMGPKWDQVYHPNEELSMNYLTGDAGIHVVIRQQMKGGQPAGGRSTLPQSVSPTAGKGRLLLEESPEEVRKRARAMVLGAGILIVLAVAFVLGWYVVAALLYGRDFLLMFSVGAIIFTLLFIAFAALLFAASRKMTPTRVYETGIETYSPLGTKRLFMSYGELLSVREVRNRFLGDYYAFATTSPSDVVIVSKSMRGFPEMLNSIRPRMGKAEFVVRPPETDEEKKSNRRLEYAIYASGPIIGIVMGVFVAFTVYGTEPIHLYSYIGFFVPFSGIMMMMLMIFMTRSLRKHLPRRLNIKIPAAIVVVLVAYFFVSAATLGAVGGTTPATEKFIEPKPASSFLSPGTYANTTVYVLGYILVDAGQTLAFRNCTVIMNLTTDKDFGIWVAEGGTVILENTTIQSSYSAYTYPFEIMGTGRILWSTVYNLWAAYGQEDYNGGLEIYSDDVLIDRSLFLNARLSTILVVDASPTISNSRIAGAGDDGIELENSNAHIVNNTIVLCEYAMYINRGSAPLVEHNTISYNDYGFLIEYSSPTIRNNTFDHVDNFAIEYRYGSSPTLSGNRYIENGRNVVTESLLFSTQVCGIAIIIEAVSALLVLFWLRREGERRDSGDRGGQGIYRGRS